MILSTTSTLAITTAIFVVLYCCRGGFYYRTVANLLCLAVAATYGMAIAVILRILGRADLINWTSTRLYYYLFSIFTGISVKVEGAEHLDNSKKVIVCNHQSSLDMAFGSHVFPKATSVVAKKDIKFYPILGWYLSLSNNIFLDRKNRDGAVKAAREAAKDIHRKQTSVWIFPEGTRQRSGVVDLLPFKKGAFYMAVQAKVPIVPVVMEKYDYLYDSKAKRFNPGTVRIKILPPVPTDDVSEDSEAVEKLSASIREDMLKTLKELAAAREQEEKVAKATGHL
ncbi:hypothetical protein BDB00DRAFT_803699 [Zychaea mexicana]|uniref:uncharacterized protein n=1 Tax=Zychaea mexicana TaxID=64656 RepID=UPI0022FE871B|nr:uncharacterized protein BDB00DRAFT_803699 [Zychaea mexicana]KAI9497706.1 hypothetical protein BDB00DRAFT_803699 [Zychaea mexicana]